MDLLGPRPSSKFKYKSEKRLAAGLLRRIEAQKP